MNPLVQMILGQPGMAARLIAEHADGASRATAGAVVGVLGDQAGGHPRLAEDHLDERVHRSPTSW